ncbi:GrpE-domain-containing protein [Lactarius sanguifluus]|nr:GrpE-domain-containing protein [Lactarius sanguifluus]
MSRPTLSLLRFATSSLRTPTVSHSYYHSHRTATISSRTYSSTSPENSKESPEGSGGAQTKAEDKLDSVPPLSELEAKLQAKEAEVSDLMGRLRYLQADFLNLQRNAAHLLETVDVLSLALKSVPESSFTPPTETNPHDSSKSPSAYLQELHHGVEMTQRLLLQTLFKYHVKPFDPTGDKFDPNRHEALYQAPVPDKEPGSVIDCQKTGYTIKDRVLRAAQVGVAQETS